MGNKITNKSAKEFYVVFEKECQDKNVKKMIASNLEKLKENEDLKLIFENIPLHIKGSGSLIKTFEMTSKLMENLRELSLKNTIFDSNCIKSFCTVIKNAKQLKLLDISENDHLISSNKSQELLEMISNIPTLVTLNISQMDLDDDMANQLLTSLMNFKNLSFLDLSSNKISNASLPLIRKLISSVLTLQSFNLQDNNIDDKEVNLLKEIINTDPKKKGFGTLHHSNANNKSHSLDSINEKSRLSNSGIHTLDLEIPTTPNHHKSSKEQDNSNKNGNKEGNNSKDNDNKNTGTSTQDNKDHPTNYDNNNYFPQQGNDKNGDGKDDNKNNENKIGSNQENKNKINEQIDSNNNNTNNDNPPQEEKIDVRDRGKTMIGMVQRVIKDPNFKEKLKEVPYSKSKRFNFGHSETVGNRPSMEDVSLCMGCFRDREDEDLFAVFDGHGSIEAALHVAKNFPIVFKEELEKNEEDIIQCLENTFKSVNENMTWAETTGCTAAVCFIKGTKLYSANCGDARTVVCEDRKGIRLSFDHKPSLPDEIERISKLGGYIDGGRVQGILAVSRAFGDYKLSPYVIPTPFTNTHDLGELTTHLIIACDGVWDVLPDQMVASLVRNQADPIRSSKLLKDRALASGSTDNISVIVIKLLPLLSPSDDNNDNSTSHKNKKDNGSEGHLNKKNKKNDDSDSDNDNKNDHDFFDSDDDKNDYKNNDKDDKNDKIDDGDSDLDSEEILRRLEEIKKENMKQLEEGNLFI
eukprot:TRINITY_DN3798_c1_g1_i1.p1 TRINITY_DN3798_c1_g1~~TRINITY_DN3798_c1_g1_i1.p1  ORF type:complete len:749 (-),score=246.60 TRINITY_DN3798_c1_g1_i1:230-2476(-)